MDFLNRLLLQRPSNASPQPVASSTPTNQRFFIPRFGHSSIPSYPRPRSSASKPNPGSSSLLEDPFSAGPMDCYQEEDSMMNNYGSSRGEDSFSNGDTSLGSHNSSAYYSCYDSFIDSPAVSDPPHLDVNTPQRFQPQNPNTPQRFQSQNGNGWFQKKFPVKKKNFVKKKPFPLQKNPAKKPQFGTKAVWHCDLCSVDFTSGIPYEMHMKGLKHAKKQKFLDANEKIQQKVKESNGISASGNSFRCELCDVQANSSLQFMTHLEGSKHKMKVVASKNTTEPVISMEEVNTNEKCHLDAAVRCVEINSTESKSTKCVRFACDICCVIVNSDTQLQQHLSSKKHIAKVEGKPKEKPIVPEVKEEQGGLPAPSTENSTEMQQ